MSTNFPRVLSGHPDREDWTRVSWPVWASRKYHKSPWGWATTHVYVQGPEKMSMAHQAQWKISQDSSGPRNRRNKHGRIERWSLSSGAFEVFSKYYAPESRNCSSHSTDLQTQRRGMRDQPSLPPTSPGSEVRCQKYIPEGGRVEQKSESAARQSGPRKCCSLSVQDKWGFRALGSRAWSLSQATSQGD